MRHISLFIIGILVLTGCQKNIDQFISEGRQAAGSLESLYSALQNMNERYTYEPNEGLTLELDELYIQIPQFAFVDNLGDVVNESVEIDLVEVNDTEGMIRYALASNASDGALLDLKGAIYLEASRNGEMLKLNPSIEGISVYLPASNPETIGAYSDNVGDASGFLPWQLEVGSIRSGSLILSSHDIFLDTIGYEMTMTSLGWWSIQHEISVSDYADLCLEINSNYMGDISSPYTSDNTVVYMIFDNTNTCQRLNISNSSDCAISTLPTEVEGRIILLGNKKKNSEEWFEAASQRMIVSANASSISMQPIGLSSESDLQEFVSSL